MKYSSFLAVGLVALISCGCEVNFSNGLGSGVKGSGVSKTESREIAEFDSINFEGFGSVEVEYGEATELTVTADDNLLELIETNVVGNELKIAGKENYSTKIGHTFKIKTPQLKNIKVGGAANIKILNAQGEDLTIDIEGAARLTGNGEVAKMKINIAGAGNANLAELKSENVQIKVEGAGQATVFASKSVDAKIEGVGSITVHGNPADVKKGVDGLGRIKIKD